MKFSAYLSALIATAVLLGGCASSTEIDRYRTQYRAAQERILDLEGLIEDKNRQIEVMRMAKDPNADLSARLASALSQQADLEAQVAKLKDQLARAQDNKSPLPIELSDELGRLADANPDLMTYDKETGMIRFRSDVTFALGKADVRDSAIPIIAKLAGVLQSPVASDYEVRVVGHTDNVPMRSTVNIQRFGDNWGLSTGRAISVMKQFKAAGIKETRMSVAGYGEFQPVEANGEKGSEANRRVEIFLVPRATPAGAASEAPAPAEVEETTVETESADGTVAPMESTTTPPSEPEESFK